MAQHFEPSEIYRRNVTPPADPRVESNGSHGCHKQNGPHSRPATTDPPLPAQGSAVAIKWRDADECGDLFMIQRAELRQVGDERIGELLADAGSGH